MFADYNLVLFFELFHPLSHPSLISLPLVIFDESTQIVNLSFMHSFTVSFTTTFLGSYIPFCVFNLCSCLNVREKLAHHTKNWKDLNVVHRPFGSRSNSIAQYSLSLCHCIRVLALVFSCRALVLKQEYKTTGKKKMMM